VARDIVRKLRLTATALGLVTRKDLAAAFRRANANTSFVLGRADKWLQGRAQPRELQVYEDWSKVLELDRPGQWIADCDIEAFIDEICARRDLDREALLRGLELTTDRGMPGSALELSGTFVCYSHAWSPYFHGRLIRGALSVNADASPARPLVTYTEVLPTGPMVLKGSLSVVSRGLHALVSDDSGSAQVLTFSLFRPSPPASVLAGFMSGTTVLGPDAQPSATRLVAIRLPAAAARLRSADAYLPLQGSVAADLTLLGLRLDDPDIVDRCLDEFLNSGSGRFDQIPVPTYRALADVFDRIWLTATT
jgi:hypothetical protein